MESFIVSFKKAQTKDMRLDKNGVMDCFDQNGVALGNVFK